MKCRQLYNISMHRNNGYLKTNHSPKILQAFDAYFNNFNPVGDNNKPNFKKGFSKDLSFMFLKLFHHLSSSRVVKII